MGRLRLAALVLAALVLWVALLRLPAVAPGPGIDDGWFLAFAIFLKQGAQAGRDYVFTYGPLGYFLQRSYDGDLFAAKYAWELVVKGAFTAIAFWCLSRQTSGVARCALYLALLSFPGAAEGSLYTLMIVLLGILLLNRPRTSPLLLAGAALLLAVLALAKFTILLVGALVVVVLCVDLAAAGELRKTVLVGGTFLLGLAGTWMLTGQALATAPDFLRSSWEMSAGYTDAMAFDGPLGELLGGLLVLVLCATTLVAARPWPGARRGNALALGLLAIVSYFLWKNGFVRQDLHSASFFSLTLPIALALPALLEGFDWGARRRVLALSAAALLSAWFLSRVLHRHDPWAKTWPSPVLNLTRGTIGVLRPGMLRALLEERSRTVRDGMRLPALQKIAADAPLDAFGNHQGWAILNGMRWRPRPSFQSYAAYTERLARANEAFFEGSGAPRFVLFHLEALDDRFPAHEDGLALRSILAHYHPLAASKGFLLLERGGGGEAARLASRGESREVAFDQVQVLEPSEHPRVLRVEIEKSWLGKLASLVLKPPLVELAVEVPGQRLPTYRLVPSLARTGFLLDPLLLDTQDVIYAYAPDAPRRRVARYAVSTSAWGRRCYASVRVAVDTLESLTGEGISAEGARLLGAQLRAKP